MKNWIISLWLLVTYAAMQFGSIFLGQGLFDHFPWDEQYNEKAIAYRASAWSLFISNALAAVVFLWFILRNKKFLHVFKVKKSTTGNAILWGILGFFLVMGGQMLAAMIESLFGITPGSDNTAILSNIAKVSPIIIISIVVFAPFLEEIVFRRILFGGIYQKTNFWIAAIASALVFAAMHNEFEHLLMYMAPGLIFSYLYYRTKRLLTPMIAHLLMNGFVVIAQLKFDDIQRYLDELKRLKQAMFIFFY
ncbi:CPBP family intramembrane glutamic endopeptidase [Sporosarcina beigongshangi]|uniref:CPBP family intramembrane glutamic endopeptidase n=1 Tax=Sporosarcina beigongshangi TaxID=2782538 RepID=UPI00193AB6D9|nr:type II CAAX endopeptidase family protein [Sporosarcina beigongshangi]